MKKELLAALLSFIGICVGPQDTYSASYTPLTLFSTTKYNLLDTKLPQFGPPDRNRGSYGSIGPRQLSNSYQLKDFYQQRTSHPSKQNSWSADPNLNERSWSIVTITKTAPNGTIIKRTQTSELNNEDDTFKLSENRFDPLFLKFPSFPVHSDKERAKPKKVQFGIKYDAQSPEETVPFRYGQDYSSIETYYDTSRGFGNRFDNRKDFWGLGGLGSFDKKPAQTQKYKEEKAWIGGNSGFKEIQNNSVDSAEEEDDDDSVGDRKERASIPQTKKLIQLTLHLHNSYRKKHNVPPLRYDSKISVLSQEWAEYLVRSNKFQHRPNNKYGENLFLSKYNPSMSNEDAMRQAVKGWYDEIQDYRLYFGIEPNMINFHKWGHFTQVIWKSSRRIGLGIARRGDTIIVCVNYDPPGNYVGQFAKNVPRG